MSELFAAIQAEAMEGRLEYAKDVRFHRLLAFIEPLSQETVVMMLMDWEDALQSIIDYRPCLRYDVTPCSERERPEPEWCPLCRLRQRTGE